MNPKLGAQRQGATARSARARTRIIYGLDAENRMIVGERDSATGALYPVRIVEGRLAVDRRNRLFYHVRQSSEGLAGYRQKRIKLDGTWGLTSDHELKYALHNAQDGGRRSLYLKGAITDVKSHALIATLRRASLNGRTTSQRFMLFGRWQADTNNRLSFLVERAGTKEDRLTLQGGWRVGRHYELLYRYRQRKGRSKEKINHILRFRGIWDIDKRNRLTYRLGGSSRSVFAFRASLQTPSLSARNGRIAYQVGIELSGGRLIRRRVVLFGRWKLNRDLSVSFELPYSDGRSSAIRFKVRYVLSKKNAVSLRLLDRRRQPLGITVTFTRQMAKDTNLFLRLRKEAKEAEAIAGVHMRF